MITPLVEHSPDGLYCAAGGFHIDPWRPVKRAIITHAHGDHLQAGCQHYLTSNKGSDLVRLRLPEEASVEAIAFGEQRRINGVLVSLHAASHMRGSSQVRLEYRGHVAVVSGDFQRNSVPGCDPFEVIPCNTWITETTFGLPIFSWPDPQNQIEQIEEWWRSNQQQGRASVLFAYAMGKAQRILSSLPAGIGPIFTHGAVERICEVYRRQDTSLPATTLATSADQGTNWKEALIIAPPSAQASNWLRRFGPCSTAIVSGWMRVRGFRRRRAVDRGFVISDHADWPALLQTVQETGAETILTTHGYAIPFARVLRERGYQAEALPTPFHGETLDESEDVSET